MNETWEAETFQFLNDLPGFLGVAIRNRQAFPYGEFKFCLNYPFDSQTFLELVNRSDKFKSFLDGEASSEELFNAYLSDGRKTLVIFSPLIKEDIYLGEVILVLRPLEIPAFQEMSLFLDLFSQIVVGKIQTKSRRMFKRKPVEEFRDLDFIIGLHRKWTQSETTFSGDMKDILDLWFNEDVSYLSHFLSGLQRQFDLETVFAIQKVPLSQTHLVVNSYVDSCESLSNVIKDSLEDFLAHESFGTLSTIRVKVQKTLFFPTPEPFSSCLSFICEAGGTHFGMLGIFIRKDADFHHVSKVITVLTNHLAFRFAHLFQLRRQEVRRIFFQKISSVGSKIAFSVEIEPIIEMLVQALGSLFGIHAGAICLIHPGSAEIEKTHVFGNPPEGFNLQISSDSMGELRKNVFGSRIYKTPGYFGNTVRCIVPFQPIYQSKEDLKDPIFDKSIGSLLVFESPVNTPLDDEAFDMLMILLNNVCGALLSAWNYQEKIDTIRSLESLINKLSDKKTMLDEMMGIIQRFLMVKCCSLLTLLPDSSSLVLEQSEGLPLDSGESFKIKVGEEISGYVALKGETLRIESVEDDPRFKNCVKENFFKGPLLSVPLISLARSAHSRVVGVINVNHKLNGLPFSKQDQILLETIAHIPAVALDNMQLSVAKRDQELLTVQLNAAKEIQAGFLPKSFKNLPSSVSIYGKSEPARRVGGDFFDVNLLSDGDLLLSIGDVSGKDMPAALLMAATLTFQRTVAQDTVDLVEILGKMNKNLRKVIDDYHFVTLMLVKINPNTGEATMASAGHGPLLAVLNGNLTEIPSPSGSPLGVWESESSRFKAVSFHLSENDVLLFFTDGLADQKRSDEEMFGYERIKDLLFSSRYERTQQIVDLFFGASNEWRSKNDLSDDLTIMALKFLGNESIASKQNEFGSAPLS
ncbi:SpoIIE family protein phosphatase [bacterium]|nr:SpoIIE family protein phosphatase [bacterium]